MNPKVIEGASKSIEGKTILVTGGTGSFGQQIVDILLEKFGNFKELRIFSRDEQKQHFMRQKYTDTRIKFIVGDVRDFERVYDVTKDVNIVFHAAALKHVPYAELYPMEAVKTNILGADNVRVSSIRRNVSILIGISTDKAVKPVNSMGMSKAIQEKVFLARDVGTNSTKISMVRYGNVIGSRGSVIPFFKERIEKKLPLPVTHPTMTRFLITLEEAIELVFYAMMYPHGNRIFVRKAPASRITDLAEVMGEKIAGNKNYPVDIVGIRPGEKIHETLVSEEEMIRSTEEEEFYVVHPHDEFFKSDLLTLFPKTKVDEKKVLTEYTSENTTRLTKKEIEALLKRTGWV